MKQLKYTHLSVVSDTHKNSAWQQFLRAAKIQKPMDIVCILLPLCAIALWSVSLNYVDIRAMTDLGLISVLPASTIIALAILTLSFCLTLQQPELREPAILLHLFLLIFMLYGITTLVEEAPRFDVVYQHAGYTEYIMRTGSVDPYLDAYFNWPGFFVLSAFVTQIVGYHNILPLAAWATVFFNLLYMGPLYIIFTSATTNERIVWLGLWFFYVTNWIGQDYFSPQGLDFFLYLVIIAILLHWFKITTEPQPRISGQQRQHVTQTSPWTQKLYNWYAMPDMFSTPTTPRQRITLLSALIIIFAFVVFSHPLTPFFVLASVAALVIFRRCTPLWLPFLLAIMIAAWLFFMARPFLDGHLNMITGDFGQVGNIVNANVSAPLAQGSPEHNFITVMRITMTALIWGMALIGAIHRLREGYHDLTYILLAIAPFPLIIVQSYDGEMLLRVYLFSLPMMVFFAASLFYTPSTSGKSLWMTSAIIGTCLVLLGGFLFTRYGNERMDYMTYAEVDGVSYFYNVAAPHSLLVAGWDDGPLRFQDLEKYNYASLSELTSKSITTSNINAVIDLINSSNHTDAYVVFTRSQKAAAELYSGLPPGALDRLENALLQSGKFQLMYSNTDVQVLKYLG